MTDKELISIVDAKAKKLWNEINTGHEYSIIDSYNQFYGICMEIAEMVQEEPVSIWHDANKDLPRKDKEVLAFVIRPDLRAYVAFPGGLGTLYSIFGIIDINDVSKWCYIENVLKL